jgi:dTDP-4-amino-4,6-dideoxygalactose transaminase
MKRIPFNKSHVTGRELGYIADVIENSQTCGDGLYTKKCQAMMENAFSARKVLLTTSCTAALEMSALLCDLQPGDEVILPSFTFVSSANVLVSRGIVPRFVDIRRDTKNIDESLISEVINEKTRAIMPVHYAGVGCDMDTIGTLADQFGLKIIEDAAQGVNACFRDKPLGTIGDFGAYSFHETKNYSAGEGGALLINSEAAIERAEILWEKGTNRSKFFRGEVDKYTWVDIGSSFLPSDILAAYLYAQLESLAEIDAVRQKIYNTYVERMQPLSDEGLIELPVIPPECGANAHMFYILTADEDERQRLIEHLKSKGIVAIFHYVPLHTSPMGRSLGYDSGELPVTEDVAARLLRLPLFYSLSDADMNRICVEVSAFYGAD